MSHVPNEDLFEATKMTFGEHLEELRACLVKSLIGFAICFLLGLAVASLVVRKIERPLTLALEKFYFDKAVEELTQEYGPVPGDVTEFMQQKGLVFEEFYWELTEAKRIADTVDRIEKGELTVNAKTGDTFMVIGEPSAPTAQVIKTRIWKPMEAVVKSLSAYEPFMIWLKAAMITGAVMASPWIFYQVWGFVAAGLYPHEKNYVHIYLPFSLGLFLAGAALAFFFVFEPVLDFLFDFNRMMNIDPDPRISEWMSFVLLMPLGFGVSFQLPLVMLLLDRIGIMSVDSYLSKWRIAVLVIFVVSMFLTPADPISMLLMACPLTVLYFGGIALCRWMPRRRSPFGEGYDPQ